MSGRAGDRRVRHRPVQRLLPDPRPADDRRLGAVRDPPGALGRLRQRLQDHGPLLHGERDVGIQDACGRRVCSTRGTGSSPTAGSARRRSRISRRARTTPTDRARTRPSPSSSSSTPTTSGRQPPAGASGPLRAPGVDDDPVDVAVEPGAGRGPRHRVRRLRAPRRTHRRSQPSAPGAYPELFGDAEPLARFPGSAPGRSQLPSAVRVLRRSRRRVPGARWRLRRHRRRHRGRPHGPGLRRGGLRPLPRSGHRRGVPRRRPAAASPPRSRPTPGQSSSTPTPRSSPT